MRLARDDRRSLLAWMLFASVLLSLFACGLHHGQMNGLNLSGLNAGAQLLGLGAGLSAG